MNHDIIFQKQMKCDIIFQKQMKCDINFQKQMWSKRSARQTNVEQVRELYTDIHTYTHTHTHIWICNVFLFSQNQNSVEQKMRACARAEIESLNTVDELEKCEFVCTCIVIDNWILIHDKSLICNLYHVIVNTRRVVTVKVGLGLVETHVSI